MWRTATGIQAGPAPANGQDRLSGRPGATVISRKGGRQPRISQTSATPAAAATSPPMRMTCGGWVSSAAVRRFRRSGNSAIRAPSMTRTSASPVTRSPMPTAIACPRAVAGLRRRGWRGGLRLAVLAAEIAEELAARRPDISRVVGRQTGGERLHRPVEIEEDRVLAIGGVVCRRRQAVALAAQDLRLLAGLRQD